MPPIRLPLTLVAKPTLAHTLPKAAVPVLSVPMMINPNSPTMITVDIAYRISTLSDYAVANALCLMSLLVAAGGAWFYLQHAAAERSRT